jgi:HTH-type transcriptional regulator, transcriptional repressor of NAD biosynthesis genes
MAKSAQKRFAHAVVVGKFAPLHLGHQHLLDHAASISNQLTIVMWSTPDFVDMPYSVREGWLHSLYPHATVLVGHDGPGDDAPEVDHRLYMRDLLRRNNLHPDVLVSSEAYGEPTAAVLGCAHELVDQGRLTFPISGTALRENVHDLRQFLAPIVYRHFVEFVVIMGAESTGKSTLAQALADRFATEFVPEYGRIHYEQRGGILTLQDYVEIARIHREHEDQAATRANRFVFIDTNAITTMFFSHYYEGDSLSELRDLARMCATRYAHVVVCNDDIPFEQDGWRDTELWRERMQGMVLHDLAVREIDYTLVSGSIADRVDQVAAAITQQRIPDAVRPSRPPRNTGPRPT